jgi:hypothetical protein
MAAEKAPAWLKAWLRLSCAGMRRCPTSPRHSAASAGGITAAAAPIAICAPTTQTSSGRMAIARHPATVTSAAAAMSRRLMRSASTNIPAGIWLAAPAILLTAMAMPMAPAPQWHAPLR